MMINDQGLKLLSKHFKNISEVTTEIINLKAILNLPKGTEHFLTDIHGESEAFEHVLRNASGVVKRKINATFKDDLTSKEKQALATVVYYPKEKISYLKKQNIDMDSWLKETMNQLILLCRAAGYKYTRSKVRKAIPKDFQYIIEELFHEKENNAMKKAYFDAILDSIIEIRRGEAFVIALSQVIRRLVIDHLHIVGDIFDRGQGAHLVLDSLMNHHSVDIQWGNHDILWMGAAAGSKACIANAIRVSLRYDTLDSLENGYGINLSPLVRLAMEVYGDDPCQQFIAKAKERNFKEKDIRLMAQMQKAISVIQFKCEGQVIKRRPDFEMKNRLLLDKIDLENQVIEIQGEKIELLDGSFPTLDINNPYELTTDEKRVIDQLRDSFLHSDRLQKHVKFLYKKGNMYKVYNNNLLFHACIPMINTNTFESFKYKNKAYAGPLLLDFFNEKVNRALKKKDVDKKEEALDFCWYLWCGEKSPLFGKKKMATFERYFIKDKKYHKEEKNPYYDLREREDTCTFILKAFGLDNPYSHIVNGHVPVKVTKGESPIKGGGRLIAIDGGFSKAYQGVTGIAGYTLIYNSQGMILVSHEAFQSKKKAIEEDLDMLPTTEFVHVDRPQIFVADTNIGAGIKEEIEVLKALLKAYEEKRIKQQ